MEKQFKSLNWILASIAALPLGIVLTICGNMLYIIWPDLDSKQRAGMVDGLAIISLPGIGATLAALWALKKQVGLSKSTLGALTGLVLLCFYVFFVFVEPNIFMRSWMFDHDTYLGIVISGLIPLFYFLLYYMAETFAIETRRGLIVTILSTVLLPVVMYLGFNIVRMSAFGTGRIWQPVFFTLTTAFSFVLIRLGAYIMRQSAPAFQKPAVMWMTQLICVGVLPFIGLTLNAWGPVARESQSVLGNFTAREFWWLTGLNALLYLLPQTKSHTLNLTLAGLRAAGFGFVLYFCIVFILFLPLALVLIAAIGLGVLLLIPYISAAAQFARLRLDYATLVERGDRRGVIALLVAGFLILPVFTLVHIYSDRAMLTRAIDFLERPPLSLNQSSHIDPEKILTFAEPERRMGRGIRNDRLHVPIYDTLYRSIVLDGAELSEALRQKIRSVFGGENAFPGPARPIQPQAELDEVSIATSHDSQASQSTLRIRVNNPGRIAAEWSANLKLPDNAFISGHWLTIDGVEVPAQITTKSTAIWIYNRITEASRDPSLIFFQGKNLLSWKIFPVPPADFRTARLQITHFGDATVTLGSKSIALRGTAEFAQPITSTSGRVVLLPAAASELTRRPYLHLVVDCSKHGQKNYYADANAAASYFKLPLETARVSFANHELKTVNMGAAADLKCPATQRGFFLELALRSILYAQHESATENFPLIVVLSAASLPAVSADLSFLTAIYPDADGWALYDGKNMSAYNFSGKRRVTGQISFPQPVQRYEGKYFSGSATLALLAHRNTPTAPAGNMAKRASLDGFEYFYDYLLGTPASRARAVVHAIDTGIVNPATGSIVLETEAQRRRLAELHKKTLSSRNQLDQGNQPRMSEPWTYVLLAIPLIFFLRRGKIKRISGI